MKVSEIASLLRVSAAGDLDREIHGVAALETAGPADVAFVESAKSLDQANDSRAGCLLVPEGAILPGKTTVAVPNPKLALIRIAAALNPPAAHPPGIHPSAVVAPDAELASDCSVGANAVIESGASIGAGTRISPGVYVGQGVQIGANCTLHPNVTVYSGAQIGDRVTLHSGVVVGSDGFGYVFAEGRHVKFPQLGKIIIEDDVEIGSNTTLDRGSLGTTVIGEGTKIDNLVQIAHNVRIGRHCIIVSQTGISGGAEVGDYVVMAGQVGVGERAHIQDRVIVGGQAGVLPGKIVRSGSVVWGTPCRPMSEFKKTTARLARLDALAEKVQILGAQMAKLSSG